MLLQMPIGKLSDMMDRRKVVLMSGLLIILTSIFIYVSHSSLYMLYVAMFVFGGSAFVIYPLSISHASDMLEEHEIVGAIGIITIAYGVGSVLGPLLITNVMTVVGPYGFFLVMILLGAILCLYALYRLTIVKSSENPVNFVAVSPVSMNTSEVLEVVSDNQS
jgi:MFS family permease